MFQNLKRRFINCFIRPICLCGCEESDEPILRQSTLIASNVAIRRMHDLERAMAWLDDNSLSYKIFEGTTDEQDQEIKKFLNSNSIESRQMIEVHRLVLDLLANVFSEGVLRPDKYWVNYCCTNSHLARKDYYHWVDVVRDMIHVGPHAHKNEFGQITSIHRHFSKFETPTEFLNR